MKQEKSACNPAVPQLGGRTAPNATAQGGTATNGIVTNDSKQLDQSMLASHHKGMVDVRGTKYPDMINTQCTYLSKYHTAPRNVYSMRWLKSKTQS